MKNRQKLRRGIILFSFFLFPATFYYLSPVLITQATIEGIINGSFIMYGLLFINFFVVGRAYYFKMQTKPSDSAGCFVRSDGPPRSLVLSALF